MNTTINSKMKLTSFDGQDEWCSLMKKHYVGAVYDVTKENMNNLIKQLEEKSSKVSFEYANTHENKFEIECHMKAIEANLDMYEALQLIRSILKHEKTSKKEAERLEKLREIISRNHVYE
jgi:hypothetical protein